MTELFYNSLSSGFGVSHEADVGTIVGQACDPRKRHDIPLLVIFGGTGDLAHRKLLPAVYNLSQEALAEGRQPPMRVLAIGRRAWTRRDYADWARDWIREFTRKPVTDELLDAFLNQYVDYHEMDIEDHAAYEGLFKTFERDYSDNPRVHYLAVAPRFFKPIALGLGSQPAACGQDRVIIEKPFGEDRMQAQQLFAALTQVFGEEHVFAIDHYLGKEMIQNILTLRFENMIFKSCWNRNFIESVEITASETVGVETRGGYYDQAGAMRDMVQNHLFQILSILAMEEPERDNSYAMSVAQQNVLQALRIPKLETCAKAICLGQYEGYRAEPKVSPESQTDTYAALAVYVDNPRWEGVPFLIRTGKKLARRSTYVVINFRRTPGAKEPDRLVIDIQPDEGVELRFNIKKPGLGFAVEPVAMSFCQSCSVEAHSNTPEAYERLLQAACEGQRELFSQWPQIQLSWAWVDRVLEVWAEAGRPLFSYEQGSTGPKEADAFAARHGVTWYSDEA